MNNKYWIVFGYSCFLLIFMHLAYQSIMSNEVLLPRHHYSPFELKQDSHPYLFKFIQVFSISMVLFSTYIIIKYLKAWVNILLFVFLSWPFGAMLILIIRS